MNKRQAIVLSLAATLSTCLSAAGAAASAPSAGVVRTFDPLPAAKWRIQDSNGQALPQLCDGDPATFAVVRASPAKGAATGLVIDLGQPCVLQRLYVTAQRRRMPEPNDHAKEVDPGWAGAVKVRVGDSPDPGAGAPVAEYPLAPQADPTIRCEFSVRFQPVAGRCVRLELTGKLADRPWEIAEIELYGWDSPAALDKRDAVILDTKGDDALSLAATELSYYLGALSGRAVPVIETDQAGQYPGTLYRIVDLGPLAKTYEAFQSNRAAGKFPATPVNVERQGREVLFRAWPSRNVLWSVWEFLDRQGVRWVYPDPHGDFVPVGKGVDLSILPLQYTPSAREIYANFGLQAFLARPRWVPQPWSDAYLYFWRNGWTHSWGGARLGRADVPAPPAAKAARKSEYKEGFDGFPHNLSTVIPERILKEHPSWCGMRTDRGGAAEKLDAAKLGQRLPPSVNGTNFCFTNPEAIRFVVDKAVDCAGHDPNCAERFWLLPMDATRYCQCPDCERLDSPLSGDPVPFVCCAPYCASGSYYHFVCEVAKGLRQVLPKARVGALAYADVHRPPAAIDRFPDNVVVQVCIYGAANLPMGAAANAAMKERLAQWHRKCSHLENYDYLLLHIDYWQKDPRLPAPMVTAIVDRARFLHSLGALDGGTQAFLQSLPYNPWNFYAYPRVMWNVDRSADAILREFFEDYFRQAAPPMLDYYKAIESHLIDSNASLWYRGYCYNVTPGSFPVALLQAMRQHLKQAERQAGSWVVRQRVAAVAEGLPWVLKQQGLTDQDLDNPDAFAVCGPGRPPVTLDASRMRLHTAGNKTDKGWFLFDRGCLGDFVRFTEAGRYRVTVTAGIGYDDKDKDKRTREFVVHVGGQRFGPFPVQAVEMAEHAFTVPVPAGVEGIIVQDCHNNGAYSVIKTVIQAVE